MSDAMFNTMISELDSFSNEQCVVLLSRLSRVFQKRHVDATETKKSPIDKFFGTVGQEESEKMLDAVSDCRRVDFNEW